MELKPQDVAGRSRDRKSARAVVDELAALPNEARVEFILALLPLDDALGLYLATACLRERQPFERILQLGLTEANPSSMRDWLKCTVPRLGLQRAVSILESAYSSHPEGVQRALYWIPRTLPPPDQRSCEDVSRLITLVERATEDPRSSLRTSRDDLLRMLRAARTRSGAPP